MAFSEGESPQGVPRSDHHAAQHQMLADTYFRKEEEETSNEFRGERGFADCRRILYPRLWEIKSVFNFRPITPPFFPHRPRPFNHCGTASTILTWDPNAQERRHSESGYDHAHSFQPPPGSRTDTTSTILRGSASPMNRDYEHHRPSGLRTPFRAIFRPLYHYSTSVRKEFRRSFRPWQSSPFPLAFTHTIFLTATMPTGRPQSGGRSSLH
ncbi:hypothetical protein RhiXN_10622 [Rhizoctonia solani]|uniref:Uncharacterized protein n=1 Tax=Rhizoctonia solani TaxID=456999 RepID=A0A8H8T1A5_9AGAM|nr:uncharacterized protein RhiXN_10622 [Rhizoctonia solani]QRW24298.1 hypothetical protein RhiXN_10622 [Rhizoctonia solani]